MSIIFVNNSGGRVKIGKLVRNHSGGETTESNCDRIGMICALDSSGQVATYYRLTYPIVGNITDGALSGVGAMYYGAGSVEIAIIPNSGKFAPYVSNVTVTGASIDSSSRAADGSSLLLVLEPNQHTIGANSITVTATCPGPPAEQLAAPSIALNSSDNDILEITDGTPGGQESHVDTYFVYSDGVEVWVGAKAPLEPTTVNLSAFGLSAGAHTITAKAVAPGYALSNASNSVSVSVLAAPTNPELGIGHIYSFDAVDGADSYQIVAIKDGARTEIATVGVLSFTLQLSDGYSSSQSSRTAILEHGVLTVDLSSDGRNMPASITVNNVTRTSGSTGCNWTYTYSNTGTPSGTIEISNVSQNLTIKV